VCYPPSPDISIGAVAISRQGLLSPLARVAMQALMLPAGKTCAAKARDRLPTAQPGTDRQKEAFLTTLAPYNYPPMVVNGEDVKIRQQLRRPRLRKGKVSFPPEKSRDPHLVSVPAPAVELYN
jgi:hypothetical protein